MKKVIFISIFFFCFELKSQTIYEVICDDFINMDKIYTDQIFITINLDCTFPFFKTVSIDKYYSDYMPSIKSSFEIYKVGIMIEKGEVKNIPKSNKNTLTEDTLFYYLIYDSYQYYKLFGFMFSDIRMLVENSMSSKPLIFWKEFTEELVRLKILTKRESKYFYKDLINENNLLFDKRINKPCNLLKYYFNEKEIERASTIILPLKPMIPLKV